MAQDARSYGSRCRQTDGHSVSYARQNRERRIARRTSFCEVDGLVHERKEGRVSHSGYIYFAQFAPSFLKIGFSRFPADRMNTLRFGLTGLFPADAVANSLRSMGCVPGSLADEKLFHRRFSANRVHGTNEWFHSTPDMLRYIKTLNLSTIDSVAPIGIVVPLSNKPRICEALLAWRRVRTISQEEMCSRLDIPISALSEIERGDLPDGKTTLKIIGWMMELA